jgi:hypothetical protein
MRNSTEALLKHARKFGTDGIAETAVELGFELDELTNLLLKLDELDQESTPRIAQRRRKIDLTEVMERRAKRLLGIAQEAD